MSTNTIEQDRDVLAAAARMPLVGADLMAFQYDSGFTVHIQHSVAERVACRFPVQVSVVLRARWWPVTAAQEADDPRFRSAKGVLCRPEQPFQAYKLMSFIGRTVHVAEIERDSSLRIVLSNGDTIHASGKEDEWEFAWYIFAPSNTPGVDVWSINCDSSGKLEGFWPSDISIPLELDESSTYESADICATDP